MSQNPR